MLTQEQKDLLEPLTHHEKYGKLLSDAMKTWETAKPKMFTFGLEMGGGEWKLDSFNSCCFVGASLVIKNKKQELIIESVVEIFALSKSEVWALSDGFDRNPTCSESEAYIFANKVSSIVFNS